MDWAALGSLATSLAVMVTASQLRAASRQARMAFEGALSREYREIVRTLPPAANLGGALSTDEISEHLGAFIQYFDLSNQQAFLRNARRISDSTWKEWRSGIQDNLKM